MIGTEYRSGRIDIRSLLATADSPVVVESKGEEEKRFESGKEALKAFREGGIVEKVSVTDGSLLICMDDGQKHAASAGEEWIEKYREETGSDVSFF